MNIVIVGLGEVGRHLAETLAQQQHSLSILESCEPLAHELDEQLDARVIWGNGSSVAALAEVNVPEAEVFLALSGDDNANLVAASLAKALGAQRTIARVHARVQREEWLFDLRSHFHIDHLFSTQRLAAVELAKYVRNPEGLLVEEIARGRIEVQQILLAADRPVIGKPLRELGLPARVRIGSIQRDGRLFIPTAADTLAAGDLITVFGAPAKLTEVLPQFRADALPESEISVVIFGGGEYGFSLAQMLEGHRYRVRIIERDERVCRQLSGLLNRTVVIQGNATSIQQLKEEQVGDADFFIAASDDDEDNVMTCLQAKNLGTKYCLTLVHRRDYADVISRNSQQLQIHAAVSPRQATNRDLMRYITHDRVTSVLPLAGGAEVLEAVLPAQCALTGRAVGAIQWPEGSVLVALLHGSEALVPRAEDVMQAGDVVYALVASQAKSAFVRLLKS
ncbi:MAG: Trk system potassium transporter TrkA [Verrucomicrobia bacterium]|nr:Trk system potassium transporter TrkA [Verrucomicrobiota bacterium]